jgi:hypothetical protein
MFLFGALKETDVYLQPLRNCSLGHKKKQKTFIKIFIYFLNKRLCSFKNSFRFASAKKANKKIR